MTTPAALTKLEAAMRDRALAYPQTEEAFPALALPFAKPTEYGLGRHGWVTVRLAKTTKPLTEQCMAWIDESFRAVAPKRVVASLPNVS